MVGSNQRDDQELGSPSPSSIPGLWHKAEEVSVASPSVISDKGSFVKRHWDPQWKKAKNRLGMMSFWTCLIIVGQSLVTLVALTFFALINFTHTPMNQTLAVRGQASPRSLAYTITAIATVFSAFSTFLFSRSLVLFLTSYSHRPTSLASFLSMSSLSRGAIVFSSDNFRWTVLSIMTLILLNSLTASFATLFSPTPILIRLPIVGRDFALDSQLFNDALGLPTDSDLYPQLTPEQMALNNRAVAVFQPVSLTAAYATASKALGFPGVIGYIGTTMNSSTGGILPTVPEDFELLSQSAINPSSELAALGPHFRFADAKPGFKPSQDLRSNYTTYQQGFTVDVKCELLVRTTNRTDRATLDISLDQNITLPDNSSLGFWRAFSQCPFQPTKNTTHLLRAKGNMLVGATCVDQDLSGRNVTGSQLLLIAGHGPRYSSIEARVCQFMPFFTTVEVQYTSSVNINKVISKRPVTEATSNVAKLLYGGIIDAMALYASDFRNKVAEDLISLLGIASDPFVRNDTLLNGILENYFRGLVEGRATLTRTPPISLTVQGGLIAASLNDLSDDWMSEFKGSWEYESLGWHSDSDKVRSTIIGIVPILLVTLSSIILSLASWICLRRSCQQTKEPFDPNNLVTLLKAGRDGSVVDRLASPIGAGESESSGSPQWEMKIQLQRKESHWALRPVIPGSS